MTVPNRPARDRDEFIEIEMSRLLEQELRNPGSVRATADEQRAYLGRAWDEMYGND